MNDTNLKISIDGGAATGKSTVAFMVAKKLNLDFINSGLMYRLVGLIAKESNTLNNASSLLKELDKYEFNYNGEIIESTFKYDLDELISTESGKLASDVSKHGEIREFVTNILKNAVIKNSNIVMEGRDIGSVVMPEANFKFFLTVSIEKAAERRFSNYKLANPDKTIEDLMNELNERNKEDSSRAESPLIQADGAIVIETDNLTQQQVTERIIEYVQRS